MFACDWRVTPLEIWFDRTQPGALAEVPSTPVPQEAQTKPLSKDEFDKAVREALRSLRRPDALRANPLLSSRMANGLAWAAQDDVVEAMRRTLAGAVTELQDDPSSVKHYRALATTYLSRVPTQ